jgi:hypothetical protein
MPITRPFAVRLSLALAATGGLAAILAAGGLFSCSKYQTYKDVPVDCTVESAYDFKTIEDFSTVDGWFAASDYNIPDGGVLDGGSPPLAPSKGTATSMQTSGGIDINTGRLSVSALSNPEGPLCNISNAGVFRASHNNDWGGMFGKWNFAPTAPLNASDYEGVSFWARAPGNTTKAFTLLLDDENTASTGTTCRVYSMTDGGVSEGQNQGSATGQDPGTGTPITGSSNTRASYRDECGNSYYSIVTLTSEWIFHRIPFGDFKQTASPNRVPNPALPDAGTSPGTSMLTSALRNLILRMPKEAEMELWMANLAFYRSK